MKDPKLGCVTIPVLIEWHGAEMSAVLSMVLPPLPRVQILFTCFTFPRFRPTTNTVRGCTAYSASLSKRLGFIYN